MRNRMAMKHSGGGQVAGMSFIFPSLLALLLLVVYPMAYGFYISAFDTNMVNQWNYVGLKHYAKLLSTPDFYRTIWTTFQFTFWVVLGHFVIGGILAGLLNKPFPGRTLFRTILVLPWVIPEVSVGLIWKWIFNPVYGLINHYLMRLGIIQREAAWLSTPKYAFGVVVFICIWKGFPLVMLLITAGLQTISEDMLEASRIDGANRVQTLFHIIIPCLKPVMLSTLILDTLWWFKHYTLVALTTAGGPENQTQLVSLDIFQRAFDFFQFGNAAAMAVIVFVICMLISIFYRGVIRDEA